MKKLKLVMLITLILSNLVRAQVSWINLGNLPTTWSPYTNACAFSIGNNIYYLPTDTTRLWEYNTISNVWNRRAVLPFASPPYNNALSFTINGEGFVCLGNNTNTLHSYNPITNTWSQKASFPGNLRFGAFCFTLGSKAYVGGGVSVQGPTTFYNDFYEYDPITNVWTPKATVPDNNPIPISANGRQSAGGLSIGNFGYVIGGYNNTNGCCFNDIRRYNPINNTWSGILNTFPANFYGSSGVSHNGRGFSIFGYQSNVGFNNVKIFEFDTTNFNVSSINSFPGSPRFQTTAVVVNGVLYIMGGRTSTAITHNDFWRTSGNTLPVKLVSFLHQIHSE
jgi:N-acetylneuraminic acid mutarotase